MSPLPVPTLAADLFAGPYAAGVRISTNSWGTDSFAQYSSYTAELDAYVHENPDFVILLAASNDGSGNRYASLSTEAVAKNVIAVGATQDGLLAHLAKIDGAQDAELGAIPPLYQGHDGRSCNAVREWAIAFEFELCFPEDPSPLQCAAWALKLVTVDGNGFSDTSFNYRPEDNIDLALCCGCTPKAIMDGLQVAANPTAAYFNLTSYLATYNARWRADFSSPGPALDGRIKPDVAMPGLDVVSARAAGPSGRAYGTFNCPATSTLVTSPTSATSQFVILGDDGDSPVLTMDMQVLEAVQVDSVTIRLDSLDEDSWLWMLWATPTAYVTGGCYTFASASTEPFDLEFKYCEHQLQPGETYRLLVYAAEGVEVGYTAPTATPAPTTPACFGSAGTDFLATLKLARGTAASYTMDMSGTSMATPAAAALVALIRQYYTAGFYPSGVATPAAAIAPSAALVKATLINSATALVTEDFFAAFLPGASPPTAAQVYAEAGHGIPNLLRGLSFPALGGKSRAGGALPTLLLPGLSPAGADPSVADGGARTYCIDVAAAAGPGPLSVTLAYTDPPALPNALYALVNNLNLEVRTPAGVRLRGNNEQSQPNQQLDTRNNVEKLTLYALNRTLSASGARLLPPYAVTVLGSFVPYSPQAFSLVLSGPLISLSAELCGGVAPTPSAAPPSPAPPAAAPGAAAPAPPAPPTAGEVVGEIALALFLFALGGWVATCYHRRQCCFKGVAKAAPQQLPQHLHQQHLQQQQMQPTQQQQQQHHHQQQKPSLELGGVATNPMMQATAWR